MMGWVATLTLVVSSRLVRREVFSSMFEVHTAQLGAACGLLVVLFFVYDRRDVGLLLLGLFALTALGYLPYHGASRAMVHMMQKPWYFLTPLGLVPALYSVRSWALRAGTERVEDPAAIEE